MIRAFLLGVISILIFFSCSDPEPVDRSTIGGIKLGTTSSDYDKLIDSVKSTLEKESSDTYKLGLFLFKNIEPKFIADTLVEITLSGTVFGDYSSFSEVYKNTLASLEGKYGKRSELYDPGKLYSTDFGYYRGSVWHSRGKDIELNFKKYGESGYEAMIIIKDPYAELMTEYREQEELKKESDKLKDKI